MCKKEIPKVSKFSTIVIKDFPSTEDYRTWKDTELEVCNTCILKIKKDIKARTK